MTDGSEGATEGLASTSIQKLSGEPGSSLEYHHKVKACDPDSWQDCFPVRDELFAELTCQLNVKNTALQRLEDFKHERVCLQVKKWGDMEGRHLLKTFSGGRVKSPGRWVAYCVDCIKTNIKEVGLFPKFPRVHDLRGYTGTTLLPGGQNG